MSTFKDGKFYFENMFSTLWVDTPVHYAGEEFDSASLDEWINPRYTPSSMANISLSKTADITYANLFIPCWAKNDVDVMGLTDNVIEFVKEHISQPYNIKGIDIIDHGWNETNKVFTVIMVRIEHRGGACINPYAFDLSDSNSNILTDDVGNIITDTNNAHPQPIVI